MSIYSNNGPLRRINRSQSQHSLYTSNSDLSDSPKHNLNKQTDNTLQYLQPQQQMPQIIVSNPNNTKIQEIPSIQPQQRSIQKLPQIKSGISKNEVSKNQKLFNNSFLNDAAERHALFNQKLSGIEIKEEKAPKNNYFYSKSQSKGQNSHKRYGISEMEENNKQDKRFLGSSQNSRWIRSQSLNVSRQSRSFKHMVRHFHKHNSIMIQALNRFWQVFEAAEKSINLSIYKLSLYDTLEGTKLKMENYLERKINLDHFQTDKPTAEWSQEQFMNFYGNYRRIFIGQQDNREEHRPYTLKKYKNCVFFGRMNNGKKQEGILHYFNGKCFQGKFKQDQKQFGLQIDEKQLYLGQFKKGLRHGDGILKTSQNLCVGIFTYGEFTTVSQAPREQSGTSSLFAQHPPQKSAGGTQNKKGFEITHSNIKVFQSGFTAMKNNGGDIYIGAVGQDGQKHEDGLQIFANGDIYIGRYQSDSPQGYGEYYWENGSNYRGQFLSGMRHGRGVWQMINGDQYEGEYMNDKKNGKGTYIWKNGSKYIGNFQNDYRHGYGQMYWQDGRVYKGKWLNGIQKNTLISLENPNAKHKLPTGKQPRPAFRTVQHDTANRKKIPLDKLKSLYNPSYH